jgi:hypothetical protein
LQFHIRHPATPYPYRTQNPESAGPSSAPQAQRVVKIRPSVFRSLQPSRPAVLNFDVNPK